MLRQSLFTRRFLYKKFFKGVFYTETAELLVTGYKVAPHVYAFVKSEGAVGSIKYVAYQGVAIGKELAKDIGDFLWFQYSIMPI